MLGRFAACLRGAFLEQVDEAVDELGVDADRRHATHRQPQALGGLGGLGVEVERDLHVVGDEPDRRDHDVRHTALGEVLEVVVDVRFEPRLRRRARTRAVHERTFELA